MHFIAYFFQAVSLWQIWGMALEAKCTIAQGDPTQDSLYYGNRILVDIWLSKFEFEFVLIFFWIHCCKNTMCVNTHIYMCVYFASGWIWHICISKLCVSGTRCEKGGRQYGGCTLLREAIPHQTDKFSFQTVFDPTLHKIFICLGHINVCGFWHCFTAKYILNIELLQHNRKCPPPFPPSRVFCHSAVKTKE